MAVAIKKKIRLIVPKYPLTARSNGLSLYSPYFKIPKMFWFAYRVLARTEIIDILAHRNSDPYVEEVMYDWEILVEKMGQHLNADKLIPAFYFPRQNIRHKAGVLLMRDDGMPLGFGRIAYDIESQKGLEQELSALTWLQQNKWKCFNSPSILGKGSHGKMTYLVETYVPPGTRQIRTGISYIENNLLAELCEKSKKRQRITNMVWFNKSRPCSKIWNQIFTLIQELEPSDGYTMCAVHGDYTPWNMRKAKDGIMWLFDWEDFSDCAPKLVDPLHYYMVVKLLLEKKNPQFTGREIGGILKQQIREGLITTGDALLALTYLRFRSPPFFTEDIWRKLEKEVITLFQNDYPL